MEKERLEKESEGKERQPYLARERLEENKTEESVLSRGVNECFDAGMIIRS